MVRRFLLAVTLADVTGTAGVLALGSSPGAWPSWDAVQFFGSISMIFAFVPLTIGMGVALALILGRDCPAWLLRPWTAVALGGVAGALIWAVLSGNTGTAFGGLYGVAAGMSLWLCLHGQVRPAARL